MYLFIYYVTTVLYHRDLSHGKFRLFSPGKANCDRVALLNQPCKLGVLVLP